MLFRLRGSEEGRSCQRDARADHKRAHAPAPAGSRTKMVLRSYGKSSQAGVCMAASNSSRKYWMAEVIGEVAPSPSAQKDRPRMLSQRSSNFSMSPCSPRPASIRFRICTSHQVPSQHGSNDGGGLVEALQRFGSEHRLHTCDGLIVQRNIEVGIGQHRCRGSTRRPELQLMTFPNATSEIKKPAQRDAQGRLELARIGDVTRQ